MGFDSTPAIDYGADYWDEFRRRDESPMGAALTAARIDFVRRHYPVGPDSLLVDIGIGGGRFVRESRCRGYDINPVAREWLEHSGRFHDPFYYPVQAASCWDSLEHMPEPEKLLAKVYGWLFVSIPVANSRDEWLASPHYKPGEHIWYWSAHGLINWCWSLGFEVVEVSDFETRLGRSDIRTMAFKRLGYDDD